MFIAVQDPVHRHFIQEHRSVEMHIPDIPGGCGEEQLGIHIIDTGVQGMVNGFVKGHRQEESNVWVTVVRAEAPWLG